VLPLPTARRVDGSMSLLVDLVQDAEDPAYAEAAARAATAPAGARRPGRLLRGSLALGLGGLLIGTASAAVRADSADRVQADLVRQVQRRTAASDDLVRRAGTLRAEVAALRDAALVRDAQGRAAAGRLAALETAATTLPVTGPGIVVEMDDRPAGAEQEPALPRGGQSGDGRVLDRDLQALVNGLWAAGAEAVSVNDLRVSARTAIRSAGEAVLVDLRPLSPPYVVRAVGPGTLQTSFVDGAAGQRLATYASVYGLAFSVRPEADLRLPAGALTDLRVAEPETA